MAGRYSAPCRAHRTLFFPALKQFSCRFFPHRPLPGKQACTLGQAPSEPLCNKTRTKVHQNPSKKAVISGHFRSFLPDSSQNGHFRSFPVRAKRENEGIGQWENGAIGKRRDREMRELENKEIGRFGNREIRILEQ